MTLHVAHCPLCGGADAVRQSEPEPNLYSEKLAELLDAGEAQLLARHANWQCSGCGLIYKREWFAAPALRALFGGAVARHPRGWDTVPGRFSAAGLEASAQQWANAVATGSEPGVRRGERELLSIVDSIVVPAGFAPGDAVAAITLRDVARFGHIMPAIRSSIGAPAAFKRFSGFGSGELWDYLAERAGPIGSYAEVGCPLWGLLPHAAKLGVAAVFLRREEPNYWGDGCRQEGTHCLSRLLEDRSIAAASWSSVTRHDVVGLFQYLDHLREPGAFLADLLARTQSAAIILDGMDAPLAIQHFTGWPDACMARVAERFGKDLHLDFEAIRPSGNRLYLLAERGGGGAA